MEYLALYSRNCKRCGALDPEEDRVFEKCHFSKGNKQCPAAEIQFAVVGEAQRFANALLKARRQGDLDRESAILTEVAKRTPAFQHKFKELVG